MNSKKRTFFTILTVLVLGIALGVVVFLIHQSRADALAYPDTHPHNDADTDSEADTDSNPDADSGAV